MLAFTLLSILLVVSALGVIFSHSPINSALCLIANMMGIAILFAFLDASFLATVQVIVYAGAVMVLVVFVLMLLNIKQETPKKLLGFSFYRALLRAGCSCTSECRSFTVPSKDSLHLIRISTAQWKRWAKSSTLITYSRLKLRHSY